MNDQRAEFPGLIRTVDTAASVANAVPPPLPVIITDNNHTTTSVIFENGAHRSTATATLQAADNDGDNNSTGRVRSASDGLTEEPTAAGTSTREQVPSASDELEPGDDFFDMIFRLQVSRLYLVSG